MELKRLEQERYRYATPFLHEKKADDLFAVKEWNVLLFFLLMTDVLTSDLSQNYIDLISVKCWYFEHQSTSLNLSSDFH